MNHKLLISVLFVATVFQISPVIGSNLNGDINPQELARHVAENIDELKSRLEGKNLVEGILNLILKHQGTSLNVVEERLRESGKNLESSIDIINSELRSEILSIRENAVVLNSEEVINALTRVLQNLIREKFAQNPLIESILINGVRVQIKKNRSQLKEVIDRQKLPVEVARNAIALTANRRKRDLRSDPIGDILNDMLLGFVRSQLSGILRPIQNTINATLTDAIDILASIYSSVAPEDDILLVIDFGKNILIKRAVNVIVILRNTVNEIFDNVLGPEALAQFARRRRSVEDGEVSEAESTEVQVASGLFDFIFNPIAALLSIILNPLNGMVKNVLNGFLGTVYPIVGQILLSPIVNLIIQLIDTIIPCINC